MVTNEITKFELSSVKEVVHVMLDVLSSNMGHRKGLIEDEKNHYYKRCGKAQKNKINFRRNKSPKKSMSKREVLFN